MSKLPQSVQDAFMALAAAQRGRPENAMLAVQNYHGGGVINPLVEHVGDLTHRMSHWADQDKSYSIRDKVDKTLRWLDSSYGFDKEHMENVRNNARYYGRDWREHDRELTRLLDFYAQAHSELPVYNLSQWLARQAAIDTGKRNWSLAAQRLKILKPMGDDDDLWARTSLEYMLDSRGLPFKYPWQ